MGEGKVAGSIITESIGVFEKSDVAVARIAVPVETGDAVGQDKEHINTIEGGGEGPRWSLVVRVKTL